MKKIIALVLAMTMALAMAACAPKQPAPTEAPEGVMSHEEFVAAEIDSEVTVDTYIQAKQSWWDNKATFYTQNEDGAYFLYEMPCTEEEYNKLVEGTKIRVTGYKSEWGGEVEITEAKFEILDGSFVAEPLDVTSILADKDQLLTHQNEKIAVKGLTVNAVSYKNDEPGDDIYVTLDLDGASYNFCVEFYLTGTETEVYKTVCDLKAGDVVDVVAYLYWYEDAANPHITSVVVK